MHTIRVNGNSNFSGIITPSFMIILFLKGGFNSGLSSEPYCSPFSMDFSIFGSVTSRFISHYFTVG